MFLRTARLISVIAGLALTSTLPAFAQNAERSVEITQDADYFGFDLRTEPNVSLDACEAVCLADNDCRAFTYNTKAQWCFLKSDYSVTKPFVGAIAGKIVERGEEEDIGAPAGLSYVPDYIRDEANRFSRELATRPKPEGSGLAHLLMQGASSASSGDAANAVAAYSAAVTIEPDDVTTWLDLARAYISLAGGTGDDASSAQTNALYPALNAYTRSRSTQDRATALQLLAIGLEMRSLSRAALTAYEASLDLVQDDEIEAAYLDLGERKGFRVLNHTVDSDLPSPRVCVQFSENLVKAGVDYATFFTVDGAAPKAVEAREQQVCVEGLDHGMQYQITVRQGLPSAIGEKTTAPVDLSIYVRDRAPSVRFSTENFVLPAAGRHGIPMVSVNSASAKLKLHRVGDRGLAAMLNNNLFLRQVDEYSLSTVSQNLGELVWAGSIDLEIDLNKDVLTSFPVNEALAERQPGVYVLTAKAEGDTSESWTSQATQWFVVSDIGLTTYSGDHGLTVFARSLETAKPIAGVEIQLLARNNEVLGRATTDSKGHALLEPGTMRGSAGMAPSAITAKSGDADFVFLDLTRAGFDLSDRGVTGRKSPGAIDVFAWTERGVYRAGETVHAAALARDASADAIENLPLTFVFERPDGVVEATKVSGGEALGGHHVPFNLQPTAMRGSWTARIHSDPKAPAIAEVKFLVEDFVPDRIEFELTALTPEIALGEPAGLSVEGRYLYGAPAAGLSLEGDVTVTTSRIWEKFPGYHFGLADEEQISLSSELDLQPTDQTGNAKFEAFVDQAPATTRLLDAKVNARMREGGGRAVERSTTIRIRPEADIIGIRPDFAGDEVAENSNAGFRVIAVSPQGERIDVGNAQWTLTNIERRYQWYRSNNSWNYEPITVERKVASGQIELSAGEPAALTLPVEWGRYRLEVTGSSMDGPIASVEFNAGWFVSEVSTETPDGLEIALDRDSYKVGDTARLKVSPRFAGELLVAIGSERLFTTTTAFIPAEGGEVEIPVSSEWGAGAYITATLFRAADDETRMPARAIGVKWLTIEPAERKLEVELGTAARGAPREALSIPVSLGGMAPNEQAFVMVAAVDVGILNLTRYTPPSPSDFYFGQRRLGVEVRDLYGRLIDGSAGTFGRIRTGGDGGGIVTQGNPPTEELVAFFSGPVQVDGDGNAAISFDLPEFNGTVRVMAVAWSKHAVGQATRDVIVRDPLVVTAGQPRFLAKGDSATIRLDIHNTDGPTGDYAISVESEGKASFDFGGLPSSVALRQNARETLFLPIKATTTGDATITIALRHSDGLRIERTLYLPVREPALPLASQRIVRLNGDGGSIRIDNQLLAEHLLDGASVSVGVSRSAALDLPSLLMTLERYPYGCAEQTVSRAMPLLYVSELSSTAGLAVDPDLRKRVQDAILRVMTFQTSGGTFGLWGPDWNDPWLDAYITEFLSRAREAGYDVPMQGFASALDNLHNKLAYTTDVTERGTEIAYSLYVLARNRRASIGDLRYYADARLDEFTSPLARAHVAAALALYGDNVRSAAVFHSAVSLAQTDTARNSLYRSDYGSPLRDGAAILALAAETDAASGVIPELLRFVSSERDRKDYTSTQEEAWLVLAARAIADAGKDLKLEVDGAGHEGNFARRMTGDEVMSTPLTITNRGSEPVEAVITTVAAPIDPLPAGGNGFSIERTYYTFDGNQANIMEAAQNDRFVVVLRVHEQNDWFSRVIVTDLLPAGFEIDNPSLVGSAALSNFEWLGEPAAVHSEFLDDRFIAAFDRDGGGEFMVAYVVRAVTPGVYAHPAAIVQDMYRPQFNGRTSAGMMEVTAAR